MKLRLIECYVPKHIFTGIDEIMADSGDGIIWYNIEESNTSTIIRILTFLRNTEAIIDTLNREYGGSKFRILVFEPTTTIPEVLDEEKEKFPSEKIDEKIDEKINSDKSKNSMDIAKNNKYIGIKNNIINNKNNIEYEEKNENSKMNELEESCKTNELERLSRQEIYDKVSEILTTSKEYYAMIVLSTIVATVGILKNDVAIIIASMIIAPLLSPNIALSFSMSIADIDLAKKSLKNLIYGILLALSISILIGYFVPISLNNPQIMSRMSLDATDVIIALCAGIVAAISTVSGISSVVVGVMIAVALLPPLVAFGLVLGSGYFDQSIPILLLFLINVISVNLSSSVIFHTYGISPYKWWEREKAKKLTISSIIIWLILLLVVILIVFHRFSSIF